MKRAAYRRSKRGRLREGIEVTEAEMKILYRVVSLYKAAMQRHSGSR